MPIPFDGCYLCATTCRLKTVNCELLILASSFPRLTRAFSIAATVVNARDYYLTVSVDVWTSHNVKFLSSSVDLYQKRGGT